MEWFDWSLFIFLTPAFASQFFPKGQEVAGLLSTLAVFAVGYFFRPLGGAVLGAYADKHGRKAGLSLTILLMAGAMLVMAALPTWNQVGVLAPVLLLVARCVQGFSAGGEFGSSSVFLVEKAAPGRRASIGAWQQVSVGGGTMLAALLAAVLTNKMAPADLSTWGWRMAFVIGGVLGLLGLYLRSRITETDAFLDAVKTGRVSRTPLVEVFRRHPRSAARVFGLVAAGAALVHMWFLYYATYANVRFDVPMKTGLATTTISLGVFALLLPFAGRLSDRVGRKPVLLTFAVLSAVAFPILLNMIKPTFVGMLVPQILATVLLSLYGGSMAAVMAEQFPAEVRASGISVPYGLAVAVFGGLVPVFATTLVEKDLGWVFPVFMVTLCLASAATYLTMRETSRGEL